MGDVGGTGLLLMTLVVGVVAVVLLRRGGD